MFWKERRDDEDMKLSKGDVDLFYRLNWSLLFYVNQRYGVIRTINTPNFRDQDLDKVAELHEKLYSHPELIDSFVAENPFKFKHGELNIIKNWKNFVKDKFLIVSHTKDYTIFLKTDKEPKAYGVLGLYDEIWDIIGPYSPILVETVLLPFKGKIIHSGILHSFSIQFGSGIRKSIEADYQKAKSRFGIILSLETPIYEKKEADEELLRFYLKNEANREEYWYETERLLKKNPSLWKIYYQEIGRSNSRKARKRFSKIGLASGWFAIFEDIIIASGQSEKEVRAQIKKIVPEEKREFVYVFRYVKK
jgi:hypothetical protein